MFDIRAFTAGCLALICLVTGAGLADSSTKQARNAGSVPREWPAAKINLEGKALPLDEVLAKLSEVTGKRFGAVEHLRDLYVTVLWKERPAREAMLDLEQLWSRRDFPVRWRRDRPREAEFLLWQDPRARNEFARLVERDTARIRAGMDRLIRLARAHPNEAPQPTGDEQLDFYFRTPQQWEAQGRPLGQLLGTFPPQQLDHLARGGELKGPWAQWSEPAKQQFETLLVSRFGGDGVRGALDSAEIGVFLRLEPALGKWRLGTSITINRVNFSNGGPFAALGFSEPAEDPISGNLEALGTLTEAQSGQLQKERPSWRELADVQISLARVLGRSLTSDYYHRKPVPPLSPASAATLKDLLLELAEQSAYRCAVDDDRLVLRWRNRRFAFDDLGEVPATQHRRWREVRTRDGHLGWDELLEMSRLNDLQAQLIDAEFPVVLAGARARRAFLAWRDALSAAELRQAGSAAGISVARTNARARGALAAEDPSRLAGLANQLPLDRLRVRIFVEKTPAFVRHVFHISADGEPSSVESGVREDLKPNEQKPN
ncbi:MAG: hypothetical protein ACK47B_04905 [Armatimonadota bacterium]